MGVPLRAVRVDRHLVFLADQRAFLLSGGQAEGSFVTPEVPVGRACSKVSEDGSLKTQAMVMLCAAGMTVAIAAAVWRSLAPEEGRVGDVCSRWNM